MSDVGRTRRVDLVPCRWALVRVGAFRARRFDSVRTGHLATASHTCFSSRRESKRREARVAGPRLAPPPSRAPSLCSSHSFRISLRSLESPPQIRVSYTVCIAEKRVLCTANGAQAKAGESEEIAKIESRGQSVCPGLPGTATPVLHTRTRSRIHVPAEGDAALSTDPLTEVRSARQTFRPWDSPGTPGETATFGRRRVGLRAFAHGPGNRVSKGECSRGRQRPKRSGNRMKMKTASSGLRATGENRGASAATSSSRACCFHALLSKRTASSAQVPEDRRASSCHATRLNYNHARAGRASCWHLHAATRTSLHRALCLQDLSTAGTL